MAFASNGNPLQVSEAIVNGISLSWVSDASSQFGPPYNIYHKIDSAAYGASDSMTFSYQGFGGESFASTVGIAPSFGKIIFPDTTSAALGCYFRYEHPVPGDSIEVTILYHGPPDDTFPTIQWTIPDTGGFTIKPHQLLYISNGLISYTMAIYRYHWEEVTSTNGKRIGIYSEQDAILALLVKP